MPVFILFSVRIVIRASKSWCYSDWCNSERWKAVSRPPAFDVVAPPHLPIFVRLDHASALCHVELDRRLRRSDRRARRHLFQRQRVPDLTIARVVRIRSGFRIDRIRRVEVKDLKSLGLEVPVRIKHLQLNHELVDVDRLAGADFSIVVKFKKHGHAIENGKEFIVRLRLRRCRRRSIGKSCRPPLMPDLLYLPKSRTRRQPSEDKWY